jgi:4-aminobutyrate aminotransferase/(S)-3-amino-2-methylpropionate transaminase
MSKNAELHERRIAAVPRGVGNSLAVYAERAQNAELWDVEGRRYVDFASGIAVVNTGHLHPHVKAAMAAQLEKITHGCFQVTPYESYIALAEALNKLAPGPTAKKTIFLSTGAEAVENAIKIARYATKRSAIIAFTGGFHGRTLGCIALTGKVHLFKADVDPQRVAAIIIEPVQGEGGFYIAPPEFLRTLRALCDRHGILLIADEIQTGFARTGKTFAIEHAGIEPDLMTVAKSIAGGVPLSAVIGKAEIMDAPVVGGLGGTFAGSPLACAAGLAVLEVIEKEKLNQRAEEMGARLAARLRQWQAKLPCIGEVRQLGMMVAIELVKNRRADMPDAELTRAVVQAAGRRGLILLSCGLYSNVIRILAPLTIPEAQLEEGLGMLEQALTEASAGATTAVA